MFKKKAIQFPSKTTLNLVITERSANYVRNTTISVIVGFLLIIIFAKFGVADQIILANAAEREAAQSRAEYNALVTANAEFTQVQAEYNRYFSGLTDIYYVNCIDAFNLVEKNLMPNASVKSVALSNNTLSLILIGIELNDASSIVKVLKGNEMISTVSFYVLDATQDSPPSLSMSIELKAEGGLINAD